MVFFATSLASSAAFADAPRTHDGFYLRLGIGGGYRQSSIEVELSDLDREVSGYGAALDLMVGGSPVPGIVIGGAYLFDQAQEPTYEVAGEEFEAENLNFNFGVLGPFVDVFFDKNEGFHAGAILGLAAATVSDDDGDTEASANGFGGGAFVGYDAWVSDQWALGGLFRFTTGSVSDDEGGEEETLQPMAFTLMFSGLYH